MFSPKPLLVAVVAAICTLTHSHTYLTQPAAYSVVFRAVHCKGAQCTNACPDVTTNMRNSPRNPAAVWRRGQTVTVTYLRNTHRGGFFRLALVPVSKRQDRPSHERLTIMHGCWESGARTCRRREECGTDGRRITFDRQMTVPRVFPDGDYLLGLVWYGGLKRGFGFHRDWYSCSHVRIRGGESLGGSHQPFFEPGPGESPAIRNGRCLTGSARIGKCGTTGCPDTPAFYGIPGVFRNGASPAAITPATVRSVAKS